MLPQIFGESATQEAERQSNYLILRTLEQRLPASLFAQVLAEVKRKSEDDPSKPASERAMVLPQRICWDGGKVESTFNDLKVSQRNLDDGYLPRVLLTMQELSKIQQCRASQLSIQQSLQKILNRNIDQKCKKTQNLAIQLRSKLGAQLKPNRKTIMKTQVAEFARMKTVFAHADFATDEVSSIFNVQFDQTGRFIISGADDGVVKVWDSDTLTLQASLHGHFDYITDIDISKCNRFVASSGKDAQIIIWDLRLGKIVKKLNKHTQLINRIQFIAPKLKSAQPSVQPTDKATPVQVIQQTSVKDLSAQFKKMSLDSSSFGPEVFQVQDQFLLSCSDDGTVRLYDFSPLSRVDPNLSMDTQKTDAISEEQEDLRIRRSNRRPGDAKNSGPAELYTDVNIFEIELTPDDFRPGQRNKKLDTLGCSSQGLVVAGTNTGEIFAWKVNFREVQRQNAFNASKFLGQFKIQKHGGIQYIEFSPKNDLLLVGSTDGTVRILDLSLPTAKKLEEIALKKFTLAENSRLYLTISETKGCQRYNSLKFYNEEGEEEEEVSIIEKLPEIYPSLGQRKTEVFVKSTCDAVKWSINGRYAIASITSKFEKPADALPEDPHEEICRIKIYDMVDEQFYEDLALPSGFQIKRNSWVLAPHPKFEEILMTGSDGGQLNLWNIKTKQLLQTFKQYGVYSIDQYVMDNPLDGKFSKDGHSFIVGSQLGTFSLFSNEGKEHQYEATRVQQFFPYDSARAQDNPFEKMQNHPQLCGYNMIPYEVQPSKHLIGKHAQAQMLDDKQTQKSIEQRSQKNHEFERNLLLAKELGKMEEKYYQDQIQMCIQQDLFVPGVLEIGNNLQGRMESVAVSQIDLGDQDFTVRDDSIYDYLPQNASPQVLRQPPQAIVQNGRQIQASPQQQNRRPRLQRSAIQDRQEVVDSNEDASDPEVVTNHQMDSQFEEDDYMESDDDSDVESNFQQRHSNVHERFSRNQARQQVRRGVRPRRQSVEESDEDIGTRRRGRPRRIHGPSEDFDSDDQEVINQGRVASINARGRPTRAAAIQAQRQVAQQQPSGEGRRRLFRNQEHSSDDSQDEYQRNRRQNRRDVRSRPIHDDSSDSNSALHKRSTRRRNEVPVQTDDDMQDNNDEANEVVKMGFYLSDREQNGVEQSEREQITVFKAQDIEKAILKAQSDAKPDRDYKFSDEKSIIGLLPASQTQSKLCAFCNRADEPLIGPFCKFDESRDALKLVGQPIYMHRDCIEINKFSKFSQQDKTWVNIGTALLNLAQKYPQECNRCKTKGATIGCISCKRWFHGFKCASQFCVSIDDKQYQCLYCLNTQNYKAYSSAKDSKKKGDINTQEAAIAKIKQSYLNDIKQINRDHLLSTLNPIAQEQHSNKVLTYNPQVGDLVYYFFQGHEDLITQYSCHYFSGLSSDFKSSTFMPWYEKEVRNQRFVLCRVAKIQTLFPSKREMLLMQQYGSDSTSVNQNPQIIQQITLQIAKLGDNKAKDSCRLLGLEPQTFTVDIFPNELSEFLILQPVFQQRLNWYLETRKQQGSLIGKTVKVLTKKGIRTVKITKEFDPIEPTLYGQSLWKNIRCVDAFPGRGGRASVSEMPQHRSNRNTLDEADEMRISFWEIQFDQELSNKIKMQNSLSAFNGEQKQKLENALMSFLQQKSEYIYFFRERVPESEAPDYRSIIVEEMYFDLIMQRIKNGYYRSQEQIERDLDSIANNALVYNGPDNVISENAEKLSETFKVRIKSMIFQKTVDILEQALQSALTTTKNCGELISEIGCGQNTIKKDQLENKAAEAASKVNIEIVQSDEEEKKEHFGGKTSGRHAKNRVIQNSSGSENKTLSFAQRPKRGEDLQMQTPEIQPNIDDEKPAQKERTSSRLAMSANAQSAPTEQFMAPQSRSNGQRKRGRYEAETPTSTDKVSPSPSRPISEEQEQRIRNDRHLRKRQRVE